MPQRILNIMFNNKRYKSILFVPYLFLMMMFLPIYVNAEEERNNLNVLVVYSSLGNEMNEKLRMFDLLLGGITNKSRFINENLLDSDDLEGVTHLIYIGEVRKKLSERTISIFEKFTGSMMVIGHNVEQINHRFSFIKADNETVIIGVSKSEDAEPNLFASNEQIRHIEWTSGDILYCGFRGKECVPLVVSQNEDYYFAAYHALDPLSILQSEILHSFMKQELPRQHLAYIRLEDVHPFSDPKLLLEVGQELIDREIPFMIALIPVYINPETGEYQYLKDQPELVDTLHYLQDHGGSILLHGYTHQYRDSETGEGFEFWDVLNNSPIIAPSDQNEKRLEHHQFISKQEYEKYIIQIEGFEREYIINRVEKGIEELSELDLTPVGFEAPHYTMSQQGYQIISEYFEIIVGQIQLSDSDWKTIGNTPYISTPQALSGMMLLPETVGYYDMSSQAPLQEFRKKIDDYRLIKGSVFGMFYHPYLGVNGLIEMIDEVESISDVSWINVKNINQLNINVESLTEKRQQIIERVEENENSKGNAIGRILTNSSKLEMILWSIAFIVSVAVFLFIVYVLTLRMNLRKQLFMERRVND
ncbi:polysaccharide deacetylase family protein [Chengkuizengella axinellae]|uniref:DUF2334 domain-containing protein n=1 Tax=Chengkuizengella axinellae TaxID=3064388 RepID=A0ABT9J0Y0_9BACL|nr:polysaccharide deacetylase family protein [Chengkuizengella sp. 2205SS18-9]MDP5275274.1 DUF2334 domain-containing protein [Chengkuizengella sp. 2205SS18-9]